jgi:hypothetical protein
MTRGTQQLRIAEQLREASNRHLVRINTQGRGFKTGTTTESNTAFDFS